MKSGINLRHFYETRPYVSADTELVCLKEGRQAVVGDPERWFHLYFPSQPYRRGLEVLVVGCGNLEAARLAAGAPETTFLAIDQDDSALDQLDRLKQHYRLTNLELMWLGPDQIQVIDRRFDLVFCPEGLPPPLAAEELLRLIRGCLDPSGSLNLSVGGRHGSLGPALLRKLLETAGLDVDTVDADTVRRWTNTLGPSHPFRPAAALPELSHDAGLLDALRSCEPAYSVAELQTLLEASGLRLQRFLCQGGYQPQCSPLAGLAGISSESNGGPYGPLAVTELFRGNLRTHTVIACRDDRPPESHRVDFAGAVWQAYVPIRNPGLEIDPGPFPGDGVARLSWSVHDDPGIALIVDDHQARLFDAIDGRRSIAAILDAARPPIPDAENVARSLFEALWRRDYVWFQIPASSPQDAAPSNAVAETASENPN